MKVAKVEAIIAEEGCRSDARLDAVLVQVTTDDGLTGIGEVNVPPGIVKAAIEATSYHSWSMGLTDLLIGEDPEHTDRLWDKMYRHTGMSGRRGIIPNIIAGIDVALWDIRGKAAGKPIHHLLGGARKERIDAYLTIDPPPTGDLARFQERSYEMIARAKELGFTRVKQETARKQVERDVDVIKTVLGAREALGPDGTLMLDVVYRWHDFKAALAVLDALRPADLFFLESPFSNDALDLYARLARATPTRIALGEWSITRFEFYDIIDRGLVDLVQPGVCRVGGFTEAARVARYAADRGRLLSPYGWWATNVGLMASLHLAATCDHCPFVEYVHPEFYPSSIRNDLIIRHVESLPGGFALPKGPGLGVEINQELLKCMRRV
jgi:L-alanine-DL-glutamate epimerase-like enolase superfamily enzyme